MKRLLILCVLLLGIVSISSTAQACTTTLEVGQKAFRNRNVDYTLMDVVRSRQTMNLEGKTQSNRGTPAAKDKEINYRVIQTERPGQLKELLGEDLNLIDSLNISGPINDDDFTTMWSASFYGNLTGINLKKAEPENGCIPDTAFCRMIQFPDSPFGNYVKPIKLKSIVLPEKLKEIGFAAFESAENIEYLELPEQIERIGYFCFSYALKFPYTRTIKLPESLVEIEDGTFMNCGALYYELPNSIKNIGKNAFAGSTALEINLGEGLEQIGDRCFAESLLEEVRFPHSFRRFSGNSQFFWAKNLRKVNISDEVDSIPDFFCDNSENIEKLHLPKNLVHIGEAAFRDCRKLTALHLPENTKSIMRSAFARCYGIHSIVLPETVEKLGVDCFYGIGCLEKLYCAAPVPPECEVVDTDCPFGEYNPTTQGITPRDIPVYVPVGSADLYRQAPGWNYFTNFVEIEEFPKASVRENPVDNRYDTETIYDLSGKRVTTLEPGSVYVRNGKKIVIKAL